MLARLRYLLWLLEFTDVSIMFANNVYALAMVDDTLAGHQLKGGTVTCSERVHALPGS